jgi:endonuclease/exonuclease/phosphatase family metal-dependent hydrolase
MTPFATLLRALGAAAAGLLLASCAQAAREDTRLTLATWNAEWLMEPATFDALIGSCTERGQRAPGSQRSIPCNLAPRARWSDEDLARLAAFAASTQADVFALQEVDGEAAAARLFPGWSFCFTPRAHVQNTGFAIRPGIPHHCNAAYRDLGLPEDDVRWGADLTLYPGSRRELRLLAVHLKSGCNRDPLTKDERACQVLQRQVPVLEAWIDARAAEGARFAVLGHFNRRFDVEQGAAARDAAGHIAALWPEIDDGDPPGADLVDAEDRPPSEACRPQDPVRPAIDHILLGAELAGRRIEHSYRMWTYPRDEARWPDHCIRSVALDLSRKPG